MEFLSVATAVYGLAKATADWLDEHAEKEATVQQISMTISQIQTILFPFQSVHNDTTSHAHAEPQVLSCISSIGQSLRRTQEHLVEWERKPLSKVLAFISPLTVVSQLRDDDRQLHQQLVVLIAAISILGYIGNHHPDHGAAVDRPPAPLRTPPISSSPTKHLDPSKTSSPPHASDVKRFWNEYVGEKVSLVSTDDFFARLDLYLGYSANDRAKRVLKRRLDEFGAISPLNLERVVGKGSLRACVERLSESNPLMSYSILFELTPAIGTSSRRMPLLIWIDDHPENNKHERIYARTLGINTIQFASPAAAQSFIKRSTGLLRQASADSTVRLISNNSRRGSMWPFPRPGERILRFLRRRSLAIPVLVYTGRAVRATRYVARYERAGSSASAAVCFEFIRALAEGRTDDLGGLRYMM